MLFQQKQALVAMSGTVFILVSYLIVLLGNFSEKFYAVNTDLVFWATSILLIIPINIFFGMFLQICFMFVNKKLGLDDKPKYTDEFDRIIETKATKYSHWILVLGIFVSTIILALSLSIPLMLFGLLLSLLISGIFRDLIKFLFYKKGFHDE